MIPRCGMLAGVVAGFVGGLTRPPMGPPSAWRAIVVSRLLKNSPAKAGRAVQGCTAQSRRWREDLVSSDLKDLREFTSRKSWLKKPWMDFFSILLDMGGPRTDDPVGRGETGP